MHFKNSKEQRQSGIELLRIIAMFGIVINHIMCSVKLNPKTFLANGININFASFNFSHISCQLITYLGNIGNLIFLICSSWFLVNKNKINIIKVCNMIFDQLFLVILVLITYSCFIGNTPNKTILMSLFPIFFSNWFIRCYFILYIIYPYLNIIIKNITQKQHLLLSVLFFIMYSCFATIKHDLFFYNNLVGFIGIYFVIAYIKIYMTKIINKKNSIIGLSTGIIMLILLQLITNLIGLKISFVGHHALHWNCLCNPILILIAFSLFNIFRNLKFSSKFINYISSLTLLIYILHDNIVVEYYLRERTNILYSLFQKYSINIPLLVFLFGIATFVLCLIISILYNKLIQPFVHKLSEFSLNLVIKLYTRFETIFIKI